LRARTLTVVIATLVSACAAADASPEPPPGAPSGSLLVLETRPCNWLPPDGGRCEDVGLVRMGLDGEPIEELTTTEPPMPNRPLALSPDGSTIAWSWNWEVAVMQLGGDPRIVSEKQLPENMGEIAFDVTWSPDGSELVYRWHPATQEVTWMRVAVDGGDPRTVAIPVECRSPSWSPTDDRLACEVYNSLPNDEDRSLGVIVLVDLPTGDVESLTAADDAVGAYAPAWSPDGAWLAMSVKSEDADRQDATDGLWLTEVSSRAMTRIVAGSIVTPSWSPDGGHLVAWDADRETIVIVGRDGSDLTHLDLEPRRYVYPRWLPDHGP
jgi:Tol biopolymer transport system component